MFVQIAKDELIKETSKKAWFQTNNIIWSIILLYPIFSIVDYIYASEIWVQLFIIRLITSILIFTLHGVFVAKKYDYRLLLHISFFILSLTSAVLCNIIKIQDLNIYYLVFATIVLFFNLQVFWEPFNSLIQVLIALLLLAIFFNLLSEYNLDIVISNGGEFFFITAVISCIIPGTRYKVMKRDVRSQILIEKSNEQLKQQNTDINAKNKLIDAQYEQLRKLDIQKNSFIFCGGKRLLQCIKSCCADGHRLVGKNI